MEKTTYNDIPYKFEAGTPHIAGAAGLASAVEYLNHLGMENIEAYEQDLLEYALESMGKVEGLKIIGNPVERAAVISFTLGDAHPHDVAHELAME